MLGGKIDTHGVRTRRKTRTSTERAEIISKNPFCTYCGRTYNLVIDHIYPLIRGGSNDIENLTIACDECNCRKSDYSVYRFQEVIEEKRDSVLSKTYSYVHNLRKLRKGRSTHYMHTEERFRELITENRRLHSYFTKIINSIINDRFQIFGPAL
jgi:hypothetical protein